MCFIHGFGPVGSHGSSQQEAEEGCSAPWAAMWDAAWLPHDTPSHPRPQASPAQSPQLALPFVQGLSSSHCLLFHSCPLF